jgi:uncharacterized membrane protein YoaK (UPF0700 family)
MFTKNTNQEVETFIVVHWLFMSLCAGILNAIAFIGLGTFATHVTGFATLFGVSVVGSRPVNAMAALAVPGFFLIGAVISGLCVEARVRRNKQPHYDYVMYGCAFLLVLAAVFGESHDSAPDPTFIYLEKNFILLSLICMSSGLINAALSYSSQSTVRITHLTGITTDLGRGIAEVISLRVHGVPTTSTDARLNILRAVTIFSFIVGSVLGAFFFKWIHFKALLFPAAYFIYAGEHGRKMKRTFLALPG